MRPDGDDRPVIDIDDTGTWPASLLEVVQEAAVECDGVESTIDVRLNDDVTARVVKELDGLAVRVFHATRLLPHEVERIRASGLEPLSDELVAWRLKRAAEMGLLSNHDVSELQAHRRTRDPGQAGTHRAGYLFASASLRPFITRPSDVWPLMASWGGEDLYMAHERTELGARLRLIGKPTLVELEAPASGATARWMPPLAQALVGAAVDLEDPGSGIAIPIRDGALPVRAVLQPGDEEYDRHPWAPRG
jgi:hypothetical protein